ncbi:GNAT family N-acetyltransferase [Thalassobacillus pellis]|uniref:GNAT family N-acetyltransferase n=1 Tax=Thalassobacillus pellis TaxID=748008 RepID=UPI00195F4281|nr:GNAT family N-acetyltransferase [Thalassobacillus pellis]MBM7551319.1 GNAT superfamily N-acetyltransferase [Thalassobacillus pellis]
MDQRYTIRSLHLHDMEKLKKMDTGIENDYIIRIFKRLVSAAEHGVVGLFSDEDLVSLAGYTIFADEFAMLGRLRTDRNYSGQGYSTKVLQHIIDYSNRKANISWIGANTQIHNTPARKVIEKAGLNAGPTHFYTVLKSPEQVTGTKGPVWEKVDTFNEKSSLLASLHFTALDAFPYECYYPLPFDQQLFTNNYLEECTFYVNSATDRFVILRNDLKGDLYSHVKYLWDDHYEQPGFFETIQYHLKTISPETAGAWIDFSQDGFKNIPDKTPYEIQKPWILYGKWL